MLLENCFEIAVAQVLLDGGVNRILQRGLVLGQQNGDVGAGADLTLQQAQRAGRWFRRGPRTAMQNVGSAQRRC